jgi:hypothetical protein
VKNGFRRKLKSRHNKDGNVTYTPEERAIGEKLASADVDEEWADREIALAVAEIQSSWTERETELRTPRSAEVEVTHVSLGWERRIR